jgi:hypothetical protein
MDVEEFCGMSCCYWWCLVVFGGGVVGGDCVFSVGFMVVRVAWMRVFGIFFRR